MSKLCKSEIEECFDFLQNRIEKPNKELLLKQVKSIYEQGIKEGVIEKDYDVYIPKKLPRKLKKKLKKQGAILIQGYYRPITRKVEINIPIEEKDKEYLKSLFIEESEGKISVDNDRLQG